MSCLALLLVIGHSAHGIRFTGQERTDGRSGSADSCSTNKVSAQVRSPQPWSDHCDQTSQVCAARRGAASIQQLGIVRQLQQVASSRAGANGRHVVLQRQSGCSAPRVQRTTGEVKRSNRHRAEPDTGGSTGSWEYCWSERSSTVSEAG